MNILKSATNNPFDLNSLYVNSLKLSPVLSKRIIRAIHGYVVKAEDSTKNTLLHIIPP